MSIDFTEPQRRALVDAMPVELQEAIKAGERVWTTEEMRAEFEVVGFAAPFVHVIRRSDQRDGSLTFTHNPRFYFGWTPAW